MYNRYIRGGGGDGFGPMYNRYIRGGQVLCIVDTYVIWDNTLLLRRHAWQGL